MKEKKLFLRLYLSAMMVLFASMMSASAQATIGSNRLPSPFSLLYLDASEQRKALHNARLTTTQRDVLVNSYSSPEDKQLAEGLVLYNTDIDCLEFWNGSQWISLCDGDTPDPCAGFSEMNTFFCKGETIANLTARAIDAGGNGNVQWFTSATGGTAALTPDIPLEATTYWADNCAGKTYRVPVTVSLADCSPIINPRLTAFVSVMYDFQNQRLETFTPTGGDATNWQWQISRDNSTWQNIPGATSPFFTIPANFIHNPAYAGIDELFFRCLLSNPFSENVATNVFGIYFIRTNTENFGMEITANNDTIRYLTIQRGLNGTVRSGTVRIALLNLGATNNDGIGLGDFYQWGRVADGHQRTVWSKYPNGNNRITPVGGNGTTSGIITRSATAQYDANGQVTQPGFVGNFIYSTDHPQRGDWGQQTTASNNRWGNSSNNRANADNWQRPQNNPCPPGWTVPSRWTWWDIFRGNGANNNDIPGGNANYVTNPNPLTHNNHWRWHDTQHGAVGGVIIQRIDTGEKVFLPAAGARSAISNGILVTPGIQGSYWSSTFTADTSPSNSHSSILEFRSDFVRTGVNGMPRSLGASVRCVRQ